MIEEKIQAENKRWLDCSQRSTTFNVGNLIDVQKL